MCSCIIELIILLWKAIKCSASLAFNLFSQTYLINSIIHKHWSTIPHLWLIPVVFGDSWHDHTRENTETIIDLFLCVCVWGGGLPKFYFLFCYYINNDGPQVHWIGEIQFNFLNHILSLLILSLSLLSLFSLLLL